MSKAVEFSDRFKNKEKGSLFAAAQQAVRFTADEEIISATGSELVRVLNAAHGAGKRVVFEFPDNSFLALTAESSSSMRVEVGHFEAVRVGEVIAVKNVGQSQEVTVTISNGKSVSLLTNEERRHSVGDVISTEEVHALDRLAERGCTYVQL
jgi:hypothetical protein